MQPTNAQFILKHKLTISITGSGSTNPKAGTHNYNTGTSVSVTATPASEWKFDHWVLDGANAGSANPITVTMNAAHTLQAVFTSTQVPTYALTVQTQGSGSTSPGSGSYDSGASVTVAAITASGWEFKRWELDGVDEGSTNPITVTMNADHTLKAVFTLIPVKVNLTVQSQGTGSTSLSSGSYDSGASVTVAAITAPGWEFKHWELDGVEVGSANSYTLAMNADHTLKAVFAEIANPQPTLLYIGIMAAAAVAAVIIILRVLNIEIVVN